MGSLVLVIGATGNVGREVVRQLLEAGIRVRALTRNPALAGLPDGVEVVGGDLSVASSLDACLDGVDSVFLVCTAPAALDRMLKQARRVVFLSSPYQTAHPFFQASQPNPMSSMQAEIEGLIRASGVEWTFLRPGMFARNAWHWWGGQVRAGDVVRWPFAAAVTAPVDERDIAAVGVRALLDTQCVGGEYVLTGPESMTQVEQVWAIGEVLGRPLRLDEISAAEWRLGFSPPAVADMLLKSWQASVGLPAMVTSTVEEITGRPARTFREWVRGSRFVELA